MLVNSYILTFVGINLVGFSFLFIDFRDREEGGERQTSISYSTHPCIHWLIIVCALIGDQIRNPGVLGLCSNQMSHLVRSRH